MGDDRTKTSNGPLSLDRLKAAFARMLTPGGGSTDRPADPDQAPDQDDGADLHAIVEGVLFVGSADGRPKTAEEIAAALRDVSPQEVEQVVAELNARYHQDAAAYHIEALPAGFRLRLDDDLARLRDKFYGRVREAKLTPAALEVLSVVAYRQPTTAATIDKLRGAASGSLLSNLIRRGLVRVDRPTPPDGPDGEPTGGEPTDAKPSRDAKPQYRTTDRFLKLFGLGDLDQLPRAAELE